MSYKYIKLERNEHYGAIATLTLNRPQALNAMTPDMGEEVLRAVEEIRADGNVRSVVLTGAGKAFCSGGDLAMLAGEATGEDSTGPTMGTIPREFYDGFLSIRKLKVPTIAAINGPAIGAGLCLALACDLRIAAAGATLGMTFVRVGIHPGMGATFWLPHVVGAAKAWELLFTGRIIDAQEGHRIGLLNRVVARDKLLAEVEFMASEIASAAPVAVRLLKETLYRSIDPDLDQVLDQESRQQAATFETLDAREGIRALQERREPRFHGH